MCLYVQRTHQEVLVGVAVAQSPGATEEDIGDGIGNVPVTSSGQLQYLVFLH